MPSDSDHRYNPVPIPTYEEAVGSGSRWRSPHLDDQNIESQSLLSPNGQPGSSTRRPAGYRPPTVETDDDESQFSSDDDDDTAEVRREVEQMEIEEAEGHSRSSIWGKRMPFSLSLPRWKWTSWRWKLPAIRLPSRPSDSNGETSSEQPPSADAAEAQPSPTDQQTSISKRAAFLLLVVRLLALFVLVGFVYLVFESDVLTNMARRLTGGMRRNPEEVRTWFQRQIEPRRLRASVRHFSSYSHLAGTEGDYGTAKDVEEMFYRAGLEQVSVEEYYAYLNYPKEGGRAIEILNEDGSSTIWAAHIEEPDLHVAKSGRQTFAFHAHSHSGQVEGPLIYANGGTRADFQQLIDSGIDTKGAIALVRYYGGQEDQGLKVKAAEEAGFAGCICYSDPLDDGFRQGQVAPDGRYMPADGVQRDSVSLSNWVIGDLLTPGWSSTNAQPRIKPEQSHGLVRIPSLPISANDAMILLQHIRGIGSPVPAGWEGGVSDVGEWWTGNASSPIVRLRNEQDEVEKQPIWNVYGKIAGYDQSQASVIIGNHRDALAFGATDPHSGTAVMIELARVFGGLTTMGWQPLRTIEFMSWDAKEYNMIGSTEFVENSEEILKKTAYAYVNLDGAISGDELEVSGSPVFSSTLSRVLGRVWDPSYNTTLKDLWRQRDSRIGVLGCDGDYVPFQNIVGTSSLDLRFAGPPIPGHSAYNDFDYVERIIDPEFQYHGMMAEVVGLLVLELADRYIMPFDLKSLSDSLLIWAQELGVWSTNMAASSPGASVDMKPLEDAIQATQQAVAEFEKWEMAWDSQVLGMEGPESNAMASRRWAYNDQKANFETSLLDTARDGGLAGRSQFKHTIFGPSRWSTSKQVTFPAIRDAVEDGNWDLANQLVLKTADIIRKAGEQLQLK